MSSLILPRRKFLIGLGALIAAPAVVKVTSLMPIKSMLTAEDYLRIVQEHIEKAIDWQKVYIDLMLYGNATVELPGLAPLNYRMAPWPRT